MSRTGGRTWLRAVEWALALVVLAAIARYLVREWDRLASRPWEVDWATLALGSGLVVLAYSGFVLLWRHLVSRLGGRLTAADAHRVWYFGNLARYVPGKVLQLAGTAYLARAKGVSSVLTVGSVVVAQLFVIVAGLVLTLLALPGPAFPLPGGSAASLAVAGGLALLLLTPLFDRAHRFGLRLANRSDAYVGVPLTSRIGLLLGYLAAWIVFGLGFALFARAVADPAPGSTTTLMGICTAGYLAGWAAVFVPGGLGVREGVYALLLAEVLPGPVAAAVAILSRLWLTAIELLVAILLALRYGVTDLRVSSVSTVEPR
ncbi:MAG TPA: lysylphosphatidylglycerol synthase domain-containing protein [Gemmatimonadota bacterium]|nr:lysylphosphatidylglycerol synthase domain-containing protein [Gemmatimonadota bacterium]